MKFLPVLFANGAADETLVKFLHSSPILNGKMSRRKFSAAKKSETNALMKKIDIGNEKPFFDHLTMNSIMLPLLLSLALSLSDTFSLSNTLSLTHSI